MWRKPTEDDLIATLSRDEVEAFRKDFETDPVPNLISETVAWARGYIRSNGNVRMDPNEETLPASCISPAMDYICIKLLKRIDLVVNETRQKAHDDAITYFRDIASGKNNPESFGSAPDKPTGGSCAVVINNSRDRVSASKLEGL